MLISKTWAFEVTDLGPFRAIRYGFNVVEISVTTLAGKTASQISATVQSVLGAAYKILGSIVVYGLTDKCGLNVNKNKSSIIDGIIKYQIRVFKKL